MRQVGQGRGMQKRTISVPCTRDEISVISSLLAVRVGSNNVDVECFEKSGGLTRNVPVALSPPSISPRYIRTKAKHGVDEVRGVK